MGICSSYESTNVSTAKLILQDGKLVEFPYPVKVSQVLVKYPSSFICNSDDLDFGDFVLAVNENEDLLPGQLYFLLPVSRLRHPLQAEEMAALAVKASSALMKSGGGDKFGGCKKKGVVPVTYSGSERGMMTVGGGGEMVVERRTRSRSSGGGGGGSGRGRNFTSTLSAIQE